MSEAKLDAAGEAQQIMMLLAMWREIMNMTKPVPPPPPPRPISVVDDLGWIAVLITIGSERWFGDKFVVQSSPCRGVSVGDHKRAVDEYIQWRDKWIEKINAVCWRVSIPDQPVVIRSVKVSSRHYVDEILTVPVIEPSDESIITHSVRLGWLPGIGLKELELMFDEMGNEFHESTLFKMFDGRSDVDKKDDDMFVDACSPRFVDHDNDEQNLHGRIVDGWLFVYPNLKGD